MIEHFGFARTPFTKEIDPKDHHEFDFYHQEYESLKRVIEDRMCGLLLAPAGQGKTRILHALKNNLPETRYRVHYFKVTDLSKRDICREIAKSIGAKEAGTYPALVRSVQERLDESYSIENIRPVLLIDEAHDMRTDVLSMLRVLTNFQMDSQMIVSIILAGQLSLKQKLYHPTLEDIRQRMSHYGELRLLSEDEMKLYLDHRVSIAGARTNPFDKNATTAIYEISRGNMRAIDAIALKSLQVASDKKAKMVSSSHISEARKQICL